MRISACVSACVRVRACGRAGWRASLRAGSRAGWLAGWPACLLVLCFFACLPACHKQKRYILYIYIHTYVYHIHKHQAIFTCTKTMIRFVSSKWNNYCLQIPSRSTRKDQPQVKLRVFSRHRLCSLLPKTRAEICWCPSTRAVQGEGLGTGCWFTLCLHAGFSVGLRLRFVVSRFSGSVW